MIAFLLYGPDMHSGKNQLVSYWQHRLYPTIRPPTAATSVR
jgi:hypothetical protein